MIEETAIVVTTADDSMVVEVQQQSACGTCSAKSGCGTQIASSLFKSRAQQLELPNSIEARPGDRVILGIEEADILSGSIRLYLLPMLGLIGGAVAAHTIALYMVLSPELLAIAGGLTGMTAAFYLVRKSDTRRRVEIKVLRREPTVSVREIRQA